MRWLIPHEGARAHAFEPNQFIRQWPLTSCGIKFYQMNLRATKEGDHACKSCLRVLGITAMTEPRLDGNVRGGETCTPKKVAASRINGAKGGRPRSKS